MKNIESRVEWPQDAIDVRQQDIDERDVEGLVPHRVGNEGECYD